MTFRRFGVVSDYTDFVHLIDLEDTITINYGQSKFVHKTRACQGPLLIRCTAAFTSMGG